ncbi:ATP-binding protein [Marinobacter sp.]|uniref:hybrid sensor histidine kinase/response regulator n=1 Tax=Marinobacter sp. TaxID=50741 RepID=UPI003568839D
MRQRHYLAVLAAVIVTLALMSSSATQASAKATSNISIDLANMPNGSELITSMLAIPHNNDIQDLSDARSFTDWVQPNEDTLNAPRQHTTSWLTTSLHNSSSQALIRWLVLEPWRLNRVDAFFLDPTTDEILWQKTTGLAIPIQNRSIKNGKTIIPVQLNAGETQQLFLKIYSDNLPFISVESWDPVSYTQSLTENRIFLAAFLASILTLLLILAFQLNTGLLVTGAWLLAAFVLEAEKNGFLSNYLLPFLESYAVNLRTTTAMLSVQLFLATSVFILGLNKQRFWRRFLLLTYLSVVIFAGLTFVVDGVTIRKLGILLMSSYLISWIFMISPALKLRHPGQSSLPWMLLLLSAYWATTSFLLLGYTFNFYYTAHFAPYRITIEIVIALALMLTYSWQQKREIKSTAKALARQEKESREVLEQTVKRRTEDLNMALESARKASKAKVNFLGQVTHDLRSPLTAILGYAQLQAANSISPQKATQVIQDRARYMKELIDGLVDYARDITANDNELHDIYLIAFIDNLVNHAHIIAGKQNNRFQLKIETDLPTVIRCNSQQLQRILLNLLDNAAKYTNEGDFSLSIAVTNNTKQKPSLVFRVSDTGCGISAENLKKIYTPYYQSSENNPGAGLGLSICIELAENLGGSLELESELGKGTVATCTIPYIAGDEQRVAPSVPAVLDLLPSFDAQGQKAWVVEDSSSISELLDSELTDMGFEVELSKSSEDFAEAASRANAAPAVIITDYHLPGASGDEVLRVTKSLWPDVPVILLSAAQNNTPEPIGNTEGHFNAYLSKPVDLHELRLKLAEFCNLTSD